MERSANHSILPQHALLQDTAAHNLQVIIAQNFGSYQPKKPGGYLATAHGCQRSIE
jgi:hypothetical protein